MIRVIANENATVRGFTHDGLQNVGENDGSTRATHDLSVR